MHKVKAGLSFYRSQDDSLRNSRRATTNPIRRDLQLHEMPGGLLTAPHADVLMDVHKQVPHLQLHLYKVLLLYGMCVMRGYWA